ncbi:S-layer homology domain-containing protein [Abyssisolibacter fermentans]|uniref:S-layer homology domain-containing protein n=1 Tax=Abyssisolibacter fermentans TaxID=1766203 RepID=UPI0008353402|nr:S-layer homology domain-containing protein [Abyssisolibacter fermentans]
MRKILLITLVTILMLSQVALASGFNDVKSDSWYKQDLDFIINDARKIIQGYPDGTFKPGEKLTVEQFIKCIVVASGHNFKAEEGQSWSEPYKAKAIELGYVKEGEIVDYTKPITRGEMSRIVVRAVGNITGEYEYRDAEKIKPLIGDFKDVPDEINEYVVKVYDMGIIGGYPDGTFKAENILTRAEATVIIRRTIDVKARKSVEIKDEAEKKSEVQIFDFKGQEDKVEFAVLIKTTAELEPQYKEAETYLNQKVGEKLTKEIMDYVKLKTHYKYELESKYYDWGDKRVQVASPWGNGLITIRGL